MQAYLSTFHPKEILLMLRSFFLNR